MAKAHIQSLRSVQPQGPYLLGGFCNGGLVAYEMARQLQMEGEHVEPLVLVVPAYPSILHMLTRGVVSGIGKLFHLSQEKQLENFLRLRHVYKYIRGERKAEKLMGFRTIDPSILTLTPSLYALLQDDNAILDWAVTGYSYPSYAGGIQLIWAREEPFHNVWKRKVAQEQDTQLHIVPGSHIGCRTDHIQSLSETLAQCVPGAQTTRLKESQCSENIPV